MGAIERLRPAVPTRRRLTDTATPGVTPLPGLADTAIDLAGVLG